MENRHNSSSPFGLEIPKKRNMKHIFAQRSSLMENQLDTSQGNVVHAVACPEARQESPVQEDLLDAVQVP